MASRNRTLVAAWAGVGATALSLLTIGCGSGTDVAAGGQGPGTGGAGACAECSGEQLWSKSFGDDDPVGASGERGMDLGIDSQGNIAVAGAFSGTIDFGDGTGLVSEDDTLGQIFVASLGPDGSARWARTTLPTQIPSEGQTLLSVSPDPSGNVVLAGEFGGGLDLGGGELLSNVQPVVDPGCCREVAGFVAKLDPTGEHLWSKRIGNASPVCSTYCTEAFPYVVTVAHAAVDGDGDVLIWGSFQGEIDLGGGPLVGAQPLTADASDLFAAKLDAQGNHVWSKYLGQVPDGLVYGAVDATSDLWLFGGFTGTIDLGAGPLVSAGGSDIFLARLDRDGNTLWSKRFGGPGDQGSWGWNIIAPTPSAEVVLLAWSTEPVDFGGGPIGATEDRCDLLVKLDSSGEHVWSRHLDTPSVDSWSLKVGPEAEVVLGGTFSGSIDLGAGPLTAAGERELFLVKLTAEGAPVWGQHFGSALQASDKPAPSTGCDGYLCNTVDALGLDANGNAVLTGKFRGTLDLGAGPLVSQGVADGYVAKFAR